MEVDDNSEPASKESVSIVRPTSASTGQHVLSLLIVVDGRMAFLHVFDGLREYIEQKTTKTGSPPLAARLSSRNIFIL